MNSVKVQNDPHPLGDQSEFMTRGLEHKVRFGAFVTNRLQSSRTI